MCTFLKIVKKVYADIEDGKARRRHREELMWAGFRLTKAFQK